MSDHLLHNCPYVSANIKYKNSKIQNTRTQSFKRRKIHRSFHILKSMSTLKEKAMAAVANNDQSLVIDCISVCLNINSSNEKEEEMPTSSTSFAQNNTNLQEFQHDNEEFLPSYSHFTRTKAPSMQNMDVHSKSMNKGYQQDTDSLNEKKVRKSLSFKMTDEKEKHDINQVKLTLEKQTIDNISSSTYNQPPQVSTGNQFSQQSSLQQQHIMSQLQLFQQQQSSSNQQPTNQQQLQPQSLSPKLVQQTQLQQQQQQQQPQQQQFTQQTNIFQQLRVKEIQRSLKSEESLAIKGSMKSIKLNDDSIHRDKPSFPDKLTVEKTILTQLSDKISSQPSSQQPKFQINKTEVNQAREKEFEQPEITLIKQTFTTRQRKAEKDFKQLQKSISERIFFSKKLNLENISLNEISLEQLYMEAQRKRSNSDTGDIEKIQQEMKEKGLSSIIQLLSKLNIESIKQSDRKSYQKQKERSSNKNLVTNQSTSYQFRKQEDHIKSVKTHRVIVSQPSQSTPQDSKTILEPFESSTEFQIRCKLNLQDLDLLVVRKNLQLMQQKNIIQNYIEVPDNEMDIDKIHNFVYYYRNHNLKNVLFEMKRKNEEKFKIIDKKRHRLSTKKRSLKPQTPVQEKRNPGNLTPLTLKAIKFN